MIALASATWKLTIGLTIRRLVEHGVTNVAVGDPRAVRQYIEAYNKPFQRVQKFWEECRTTHVLAENAQLRELQSRLNVYSISSDWNARGGQFIGSSTRKAVDACFQAKKVSDWDNQKNRKSGGFPSHTLRGKGWDNVIVVPFWDVPGRISGVMLIGRECNPEHDFVFKRVMFDGKEAGLAMMPSLLMGPHAHFGHTKFIFTDVELAIRFHGRHSRTHARPLPLAATHEDDYCETKNVWNWFKAQNLVFWGPDHFKTIRHAMLANGRVSMLKTTENEIRDNMRNLSATEWLDKINSVVVPWPQALQAHLRKRDDSQIAEDLFKLGLCGNALSEFIAGCREDLKARMTFVEAHKLMAAKVKFEGHWIFEKPDGWYLDKTDERISNAIVKIDRVLTTTDKRSYYRGRIKFNGEVYPFTEKATTLDKGMLAWMQVYLRDHCRAGICEFYPSWNKKSLQLAVKFSAPRYAQGVEIIGWDSENRQFNFPSFAIKAGGEITHEYSCLFDNMQVPARELPEPSTFPRKYLSDLGEQNDESQIFWAVTACVAANILAPAVNRNRLPLLLVGEGAQGVGTSAAFRLGCPDLFNGPCDRSGPNLPEHSWLKGWPSVVTGRIPPTRTGWLDQHPALNCIFSVSDVTGKVLAMRGRANMIEHHRKLGSMQLLYHAAQVVLPYYLQDLYQRNIFLPDDQPDLAADVLYDMANWFSRNGGNSDAVEAAAKILFTPTRKAASDYFCELAFQLHAEGLLLHEKAAFCDRGNAGIIEITDKADLLWISQNRFSDAVQQAGKIPPDLLLITKSLTERGVLVSEPAVQQEHGWLIQSSWWHDKLTEWRKTNDNAARMA